MDKRLTSRVWASDGEHGQEDPKDKEDDRRPSNRNGKSVPGVEWPWLELSLTPDDSGKDRGSPS